MSQGRRVTRVVDRHKVLFLSLSGREKNNIFHSRDFRGVGTRISHRHPYRTRKWTAFVWSVAWSVIAGEDLGSRSRGRQAGRVHVCGLGRGMTSVVVYLPMYKYFLPETTRVKCRNTVPSIHSSICSDLIYVCLHVFIYRHAVICIPLSVLKQTDHTTIFLARVYQPFIPRPISLITHSPVPNPHAHPNTLPPLTSPHPHTHFTCVIIPAPHGVK